MDTNEVKEILSKGFNDLDIVSLIHTLHLYLSNPNEISTTLNSGTEYFDAKRIKSDMVIFCAIYDKAYRLLGDNTLEGNAFKHMREMAADVLQKVSPVSELN